MRTLRRTPGFFLGTNDKKEGFVDFFRENSRKKSLRSLESVELILAVTGYFPGATGYKFISGLIGTLRTPISRAQRGYKSGVTKRVRPRIPAQSECLQAVKLNTLTPSGRQGVSPGEERTLPRRTLPYFWA